MGRCAGVRLAVTLAVVILWLAAWNPLTAEERDMKTIDAAMQTRLVDSMVAKFGGEQKARIENGVRRLAAFWQAGDGTAEEFQSFCLESYIADARMRSETLRRFDQNFESINGYFHQMRRDLAVPLELDLGQPLPVDYLFAKYSPAAHFTEDMFRLRLAGVVLLNFPYHPLAEKLSLGRSWNREEWAMARLGDTFTARVPAEVNQKLAAAFVEADNYISEYNIFAGRLLTADGRTLFPVDLKLLSHWNLRDELKAQYANPDGLARQETIYRVMERIIDQSIPRQVINNPDFLWNPGSNQVFAKKDGRLEPVTAAPEGGQRYRRWLDIFHAQQQVDPYVPVAPTLIDRRFQLDRQIPEQEVEKLLVSVLESPLAGRVGALIARRLGRELRPFDIWYGGFRPRGTRSEQELDRRVQAKYPTAMAFQQDIPRILVQLGFTPDKAAFIGGHIVVDPARGSGHAMGAEMRSDCAHLRTRVMPEGMNYKGYNIAVHELGHTVEQVLTLNGMDYYLLHGVPNTAFTEAFAFVFQSRDLQLLGLEGEDPQAEQLQALDTFWITYEIAGVSLVDMRAWRWLYAHPEATPAEFQSAVLAIACEVWNRYYAPVFRVRDATILAVYSHLVDGSLYLPDYAIGHLISFQIEQHLKGKTLGVEMERMCRQGCLTPEQWMVGAVGRGLSAAPLLEATEKALADMP
jgi:hypothetical protein